MNNKSMQFGISNPIVARKPLSYTNRSIMFSPAGVSEREYFDELEPEVDEEIANTFKSVVVSLMVPDATCIDDYPGYKYWEFACKFIGHDNGIILNVVSSDIRAQGNHKFLVTKNKLTINDQLVFGLRGEFTVNKDIINGFWLECSIYDKRRRMTVRCYYYSS